MDLTSPMHYDTHLMGGGKVCFMVMQFYSILLDVVHFQELFEAFSYDLWPERNHKKYSLLLPNQNLQFRFNILFFLKKPFQFTKKPFQFTLVPPRKPTSRPTDLLHRLASFPFNCSVPLHLQRLQLIQHKSFTSSSSYYGLHLAISRTVWALGSSIQDFKTLSRFNMIILNNDNNQIQDSKRYLLRSLLCSSPHWKLLWVQKPPISLLVQEYLSHLLQHALSSAAFKPSSWKYLWAGPRIPLHQPHSHTPGSYSFLCHDRHE